MHALAEQDLQMYWCHRHHSARHASALQPRTHTELRHKATSAERADKPPAGRGAGRAP